MITTIQLVDILKMNPGYSLGFPRGSDCKASAYSAGALGSNPGSGRSAGEGNGNPLQCSCLEYSLERHTEAKALELWPSDTMS